MRKIINKTKKALFVSTLSVFSLMAAANMVEQESAYIMQGASKTTMIELVEQVGGEVKHDFNVISAISANLTETELKALSERNPMIRFSTKDTEQTAGNWWTSTKKGKHVAGNWWTSTKKGKHIAGNWWTSTKKGKHIAGNWWTSTKKGKHVA